MGIRSWGKRWALRRALRRIEGDHPMLTKSIKWLTAKPGRKRGIAAALAILAGLMRAGAEAVERACSGGLMEGGLCSVDVGSWVYIVAFAREALMTVVEPGVTFTALVMGIWGLWHAKKKAKLAGLVVLACLVAGSASAQLVLTPITHRTITELDGQTQPRVEVALWDEAPAVKDNQAWSYTPRFARFITDIVVRGTTALADDPELTFRPYVRAGGATSGVVGGAASVAYTRPRLQDLPAIKCQKTVNVGVAYTDYSAAVIDNAAGTVADFSSLDTIANGDWIVIGSGDARIMGAAWDMTTLNGNAATFTAEYWNGAAWVALANGVDGTLTGGFTFGVDGQMTWDMPAAGLWAASTINTISAFWVRIGVSAALDATTTAEELDLLGPIRASIDVEVVGDDIILYLESLSAVTGTVAYSGSVSLVWR